MSGLVAHDLSGFHGYHEGDHTTGGVAAGGPDEAIRGSVRRMDRGTTLDGTPEIFNTDQGSQFTSTEFVGVLENAGVRVSMGGRGRWMDNVMIERLWRSLKYENVYLNAYETGTEAMKGIGACIDFYNARRPHSLLDGLIPDEAYCGQPGPPVLQNRNTEAA